MTEQTARRVANVVIGTAAVGAVVVILRVPALRRLAWGFVRTAVVTGIPAWVVHEVQAAWEESKA